MKTTKPTTSGATVVDARKLAQFAKELAVNSGVSESDSAILADCLVDANLEGTDTHGISRLPIYLKRISSGLIDAKAKMEFRSELPAVGVLDAKNGLGQVAGVRAVHEAVRLAEKSGIGAVGVIHSQHFGAAGYYCSLAARKGYVGLAFTNAEPALPPWGSYEAIFGTNPIAMAVPTGADVPVVIDLSTSIVARGKIVAAARTSTPIPGDWALDPDGNPTTDPQKALDGSVLTMSGPKGYALALMVDILAGVITGGGSGRNVKSMYKDMKNPANVAHMIIAMNIEAFMPKEIFFQRIQGLISDLKNSKKRPGIDEILIPGERKKRTKEKRLAAGIAVEKAVAQELIDLASRFGVQHPF